MVDVGAAEGDGGFCGSENFTLVAIGSILSASASPMCGSVDPSQILGWVREMDQGLLVTNKSMN